jgi:hypothetical protein
MYLLLGSRVYRQGRAAVKAAYACDACNLASEAVLVLLLPPHLLNGQRDRVHQTSDIDVEDTQVWSLKAARDARVVVDPPPFVDAGDTVDIVDTAELGECLTECFDLLVPVADINLGGAGHVAGLVELGADCFGALAILVGDEDFDAATVSSSGRQCVRITYPFLTSISVVALPSPEAPPVTYAVGMVAFQCYLSDDWDVTVQLAG